MKKEKKILLFLDLEGTILRECDGEYDQEEMKAFLGEVDKLQQLTDSNVNIHLVSPIFQKEMEKMIDKIDRDIVRYNRQHLESNDIPEIECGAYSPDNRMLESEFRGDKVMPLKMPKNSNEFDTSRYGKAEHVRTWIGMYSENGQLITSIYCGNGCNDLTAMDYVKSKKGFVVCPTNSRKLAKQKADFVSEEEDLPGITDGLKGINQEIEKRILSIQKSNADTDEVR